MEKDKNLAYKMVDCIEKGHTVVDHIEEEYRDYKGWNTEKEEDRILDHKKGGCRQVDHNEMNSKDRMNMDTYKDQFVEETNMGHSELHWDHRPFGLLPWERKSNKGTDPGHLLPFHKVYCHIQTAGLIVGIAYSIDSF